MSLTDKDVVDALNSSIEAVCIQKEFVDELNFGPNDIFGATDRNHRHVSMLLKSNSGAGWQLVDAILFDEVEVV